MRMSLISFVFTSSLPPSWPVTRCFTSLTFSSSAASSGLGPLGVQRGLPASRCSETAWPGEPGGGRDRTSMRAPLIVSMALISHSGPRRDAKLVGLSSPVMIRRRIGYLTRFSYRRGPVWWAGLESYTRPLLTPSNWLAGKSKPRVVARAWASGLVLAVLFQ